MEAVTNTPQPTKQKVDVPATRNNLFISTVLYNNAFESDNEPIIDIQSLVTASIDSLVLNNTAYIGIHNT